MNRHEEINYVESPSRDLALTGNFFAQAFDWVFVDYGPDYIAFSDEGLVFLGLFVWAWRALGKREA